MKYRKTAGFILAASLAQGLLFPTMAYGLEGADNVIPTFTSSEAELDTTARPQESRSEGVDTLGEGKGDEPQNKSDADGPAADSNDDTASSEVIPQESPEETKEAGPTTDGIPPSQSDSQQLKEVPETDPQSKQAIENSTEAGSEGEGDPNAPKPPSPDYTGFDGTKTYWFDRGKLLRNKELLEPASRQWHYFKADGRKAANEFISLGRRTLRYDANGYMVKGESRIDGQDYFFDQRDGNMKRNTDVFVGSRGGRWVRYDKNGRMIKGREDYFNHGWYNFDKYGTMSKGVTHISSNGGKWVYYDMITGRMQYGEKYLNYDREHTGWYLFDSATGAMKYGFQDIPKLKKRVYYHEIDGKMRYGEQCIRGKWYYMDKITGAMAKGFVKLPGKRVYYNPKNYQMVYRGAVINDRPYYFDSVTGRQFGKQEIINKLVSRARSFIRKHPDTTGALAINGGLLCTYGPCMSFVWYVFHACDFDVFLANGGAKNGRPSGWPQDNYDWYAKRGRISTSPKVGDIVFFKFHNSSSGWARNANHAGFVVSVSNGRAKWVDAAFNSIDERDINKPIPYERPVTLRYATPYYG